MIGGKRCLAHELQNNLCDTFDGAWWDHGEDKQENWPEKKPWPLNISML